MFRMLFLLNILSPLNMCQPANLTSNLAAGIRSVKTRHDG